MKLENSLVNGLLVGNAVILHLKEEVSFSENLLHMKGSLLCLVIKTDAKRRCHFAGKAGGKRNDALMILFQNLIIHTRAVIIPFGKSFGNNFHQILITGIVLRKKNQVIIPLIGNGALSVKPGAGRHIYLAADDGINPLIPA